MKQQKQAVKKQKDAAEKVDNLIQQHLENIKKERGSDDR